MNIWAWQKRHFEKTHRAVYGKLLASALSETHLRYLICQVLAVGDCSDEGHCLHAVNAGVPTVDCY